MVSFLSPKVKDAAPDSAAGGKAHKDGLDAIPHPTDYDSDVGKAAYRYLLCFGT